MPTGQAGSERHSHDTKLRALAHFASSGSTAVSAAANGLPDTTVNHWVRSDEGIALVADIRLAMRHEVAAGLITNARLAIEALTDRLVNGDEVVLMDGTRTRKLIPAKDLAYISQGSINSHALLVRDDRTHNASNLRNLAADLIRAMKLSTGQTIDAEPIDAPALNAQLATPGQQGAGQAQAGSGGDGKTEGEGGVRGEEIRCNPTSLAATKNSDLPKRVYGKLATETVAKVRYDSKGANCLMLPEVPKKSRGKKSDVLPKKKRALSKQLIARGK